MKRILRIGCNRSRIGISELTGSLLMIALTLIAGAAVFAWANSLASTNESALGQNAVNQANYYKESFVIVSVQFYYNGNPCTPSGGYYYCNEVSIALYNNGAIPLTIGSISLTNSPDSITSTTVYTITGTSTTYVTTYIPPPSLSVSLTFPTSATYTMTYSCGGSKYTLTSQQAAADDLTPVTLPTQPVAEQSVPPSVYSFIIPSTGYPNACATTSEILDGSSYALTVVGAHGNTVTVDATANG